MRSIKHIINKCQVSFFNCNPVFCADKEHFFEKHTCDTQHTHINYCLLTCVYFQMRSVQSSQTFTFYITRSMGHFAPARL